MPKGLPSNRLQRSIAGELAEIAGQLSTRALQVTTPIYRQQNGVPVPEGTAVLIVLGEIRFLLTAAHVLDHLQDGGLSAQAGDTLAYIGGKVTRLYDKSTPSDDEDLVDIRIMRLAGDDWLNTPLDRFLRWDELDHEPANPQRHAYALIGYPFTKQPDAPAGSTMAAYAYQLAGLECERAVYRSLNANPDVTLLIGFDKKQTWGPEGQVTAPDLYGASGCGLWRFGRKLRRATSAPKLSAIGVRWERQQKVKHVRGTRIRAILAGIAEQFPDASSIIQRHLSGAA